MIKEFEQLVDILKQVPSISNKQAKNISHYLIDNNFDVEMNLNKIINLIKNIKKCNLCSIYVINESTCRICSSNTRERKLMIVEDNEQIIKIESMNIYKGKYYVIPYLFNKKFEQKQYDFSKTLEYINEFDEVIIGISPTAEGILSTNFIFEKIRSFSNIKITRLATGIPLGSTLEYVDKMTLSYAIKNRKDIE